MSRFDTAWDPDSLNEVPDDDQVDPSARVAVGTNGKGPRNRGGLCHLWRCRESNPGPSVSLGVFSGRSHAVVVLTSALRVTLRGNTVQQLLVVPSHPVTGRVGESP